MPTAAPGDRDIGPFARLVLRGATVVDGTGAPLIGLIGMVVENRHIAEIRYRLSDRRSA